MKRKINIILLKDYINIGKKGTIKNVSPGYAFNYLIPNSIAEIATKNKIKHLKMFQDIASQEQEKSKVIANKIKEKFEYINKISIYKKAGENYFIFGSINEKDIINYMIKYLGTTINKKKIKINNIKQISNSTIEIHIKENIYSKIKLNVIPVNI